MQAGSAAKSSETIIPPRGHYPSKLFVEVTTRCNLRCGMCVKQSPEGAVTEGSMSADTFKALEPAFPHLNGLVLNGVGEPLLHPRLEEFIKKARELMPDDAWVGFQTNGVLLDDARASSLLRAGLDRICLSLDTVSHESFRAIRKGGEMGDMESAFVSLNKAKRHERPDLQIGVEFVLMHDNLEELPHALRWAARRGVSFVLVTQLLPYERNLVSQTAYDTNTAGAISIYEHWKRKAEAEGLDIGRYLELFMKYSKTDDEQKVLDLIGRMKADAGSQGIALHLERLLTRDAGWFLKVERVFEEARQVANEEGIDVRLPGVAPRNTRRCEFVEEGGAFVSWDGDVQPCYFLWHRYRCFVGGWEKQVRPWVFGNLGEKDILSIWSDQKYRSFRENVLLYNFPFCFDCSFALCDYVQTEDFEQDCYVGSVPCGSCLWCTGLFQCL